jgi:hypothetical protein
VIIFPLLLSVLGVHFSIASPESTAMIGKDGCPTINYSSALGAVRNQKGSEWCWAMVAADLMGFAQGLDSQARISAADVVQSCSEFSGRLNNDKASIGIVNWSATQSHTIEEIFAEKKGQEIKSAAGYSIFGAYCLAAKGSFCLESKMPTERFLLSRAPFGNSGLKAQSQRLCPNRIPLKRVKVFFERFPKPLKVIPANVLAGWLKSGFPASIAFSKSVLIETKNTNKTSPADSDHEAVIAGMRWNENGNFCEFLVRNSWGQSCAQYRTIFSSKCTKQGVWLSEADINDVTTHGFRLLPAGQ